MTLSPLRFLGAFLLLVLLAACDASEPLGPEGDLDDPPLSELSVTVSALPPLVGMALDTYRRDGTRTAGAALAYSDGETVHVTVDGGRTWNHELFQANAWGVSPLGEVVFARDLGTASHALTVGSNGEVAVELHRNPPTIRFYRDHGATAVSEVSPRGSAVLGHFDWFVSTAMRFDPSGVFHATGVLGRQQGYLTSSTMGAGYGVNGFTESLGGRNSIHVLPDRTKLAAGHRAIYRWGPFGDSGLLRVTGASADGGTLVSSPDGVLLLDHNEGWMLSEDSGDSWTPLGESPGEPLTLLDDGTAVAASYIQPGVCCRLDRVRLEDLQAERIGPPPVTENVFAEDGFPWVFATRTGVHQRMHMDGGADTWTHQEVTALPSWEAGLWAAVRVGGLVLTNLDVPGCITRSLARVGQRVLAACHQGMGVVVSDDLGATWQSVGGPDGSVTVVNDTLVYGTSRSGDFLRSHDAGLTWELGGDQGGNELNGLVSGDGSGIVLAATHHNQLLRSDDHGASWNLAGEGLPPPRQEDGVWVNPGEPTAVAYDARSGAFFLGTVSWMFVSGDGGLRWSEVDGSPFGIRALSVDPDHGAVATDRFGRMWLFRADRD
ncbi:MAG: exo-alpha-sialidase [Rhodothermales bacterium]|nr:exo-alpha-sialidase [Rhodothermales bacterium]